MSKTLGIEESGAILTLNSRRRRWEPPIVSTLEMVRGIEREGDGGGSETFYCDGILDLDKFSTAQDYIGLYTLSIILSCHSLEMQPAAIRKLQR